MLRRLTITVAALAAALTPLAANATVSPDNGYGTGGTATISLQCTQTQRFGATTPGRGGLVHEIQDCGAGYFRVITVDNTGHLLTSWGSNGRVTIKAQTQCTANGYPLLQPASDGTLYVVFAGFTSHGGNEFVTDTHLCIAKITPTGTLTPTYGGNGPLRHLDRVSNLQTGYAGSAVDSHGRLLVFTDRIDPSGQQSAAFINRFTTKGPLDPGFSHDGQRAYAWPGQLGVQFGGVIHDDPVLAVSVRTPKTIDTGVFDTGFVRFWSTGDPSQLFSGDGRLLIRSKDDLSGNVVGSIKIDPHYRIVYTVQRPDGGSRIGLRRMAGTGRSDTAFNTTARSIIAPPRRSFVEGARLDISQSHYVVSWELADNNDSGHITGYVDDGSRWTAVAPGGTAKFSFFDIALDAPYVYNYGANGAPVTDLTITRSVIN